MVFLTEHLGKCVSSPSRLGCVITVCDYLLSISETITGRRKRFSSHCRARIVRRAAVQVHGSATRPSSARYVLACFSPVRLLQATARAGDGISKDAARIASDLVTGYACVFDDWLEPSCDRLDILQRVQDGIIQLVVIDQFG